MGEMNLSLVAGRPRLFEKPFPWTDADNPVVALGRLRGGEAVWVDLAPGPEDSFTLVVAPGKMLDVVGEDRFVEAVRGWFRPALPVADFLAEYSRAGGTHHAALVYGAPVETIAGFGRLMGWGVKVIR